MLISLKSKDSQTHWRRALLERKKMDQRDEEKGFMDQIRKIEDKVGVQTPQELCELVLERECTPYVCYCVSRAAKRPSH